MLQSEKLEEGAAPFYNVDIDTFWTFHVTRGRGKSLERRYGGIFSSLKQTNKKQTSFISIHNKLANIRLLKTLAKFLGATLI